MQVNWEQQSHVFPPASHLLHLMHLSYLNLLHLSFLNLLHLSYALHLLGFWLHFLGGLQVGCEANLCFLLVTCTIASSWMRLRASLYQTVGKVFGSQNVPHESFLPWVRSCGVGGGQAGDEQARTRRLLLPPSHPPLLFLGGGHRPRGPPLPLLLAIGLPNTHPSSTSLESWRSWVFFWGPGGAHLKLMVGAGIWGGREGCEGFRRENKWAINPRCYAHPVAGYWGVFKIKEEDKKKKDVGDVWLNTINWICLLNATLWV